MLAEYIYLYILLCLAQWFENISWKDCRTQMFSICICTFHLIGPWDKVHCSGGGLAQSLTNTVINFRFGTENGCSISDNHENLELFPMKILNSHARSLWVVGSSAVSIHITGFLVLGPRGLPTFKT